METPSGTVTILEQTGVSPAPSAVAVKSLPLTFFDLIWLTFHPLGRVIFYDFPHSTDYFTQTVVPNLKSSLSLALQHFTPLAGNLFKPSDKNPDADIEVQFLDGDSVSVTFAECTADVNHFSGNHVRDADVLKPLVPLLPSSTRVNESGEEFSVAPVFAIQITVFPNRAISFGFTNSHVIADGSSMFNFVHAWASIAKKISISDGEIDGSDFKVPSYDRSSIKDPYDIGTTMRKSLGAAIEKIEEFLRQREIAENLSSKKVKATIVITGSDIQALKKIVLTKRPALTHVTSFTVVCAYLWTCFAKARATIGKAAHNLDEPQNFGFVMDCRARLDPPLPASYFGNCLVPCLAVETGRVMIGDEGLVTAADLLGNAISAKVNSKEGVLHGADKWMEEFAGIMRGEWNIGIAGSPKMDYYNKVDFGFGKPLKFEFVDEPLSLSRCKDSKTDLEIGLRLPENEMDVLTTIFAQGLQSLHA